MGCFTGCFGLSSCKKRRNSIRKILPRDQRICSYEPLHSSDPTNFSNVADKSEKIQTSNLRCEEEEKKGTKKTRKKVRFNLNIQTYEPIVPTTYENDYSDEDGKKLEVRSSQSGYSTNYRYHNCVDNFEDEDEMGYGESDLEDEDYYTDNENDYEDDADDEEEEEEEESVQYVTSLLNPVENLSQWKMVKAKPMKVKELMKENIEEDIDDQIKPLLQEIVVNTSLSNWLSLHGNSSSKRSLLERSPIVDITNMKKR